MRPPPPYKKLISRRDSCKEIVDLLKKGATEVCLHTPEEFISNIFTIPPNSVGNRPVIDMRALNELVEYVPFVLKQGDFMTKFDLRDSYLTVPVDRKSRIYLCFTGRVYSTILLASLLVSPSSGRIFTKAMKPVIAFLRTMGIDY